MMDHCMKHIKLTQKKFALVDNIGASGDVLLQFDIYLIIKYGTEWKSPESW